MTPAMLMGALSPRVWLALAAVGAASLVITFAGVQSLRASHLKRELAHARAALIDPATRISWRKEAVVAGRALAGCQADSDKLGEALARQNAAVTAISRAGARRSAQAASALAASKRAGEGQQRRAQAILRAREGAAGCADADALILESAGAGGAP
jgi:hypothetical protein